MLTGFPRRLDPAATEVPPCEGGSCEHSPPSVLSTMALSKPLTARALWFACRHGEIEKVKAHGALGGDLNLRHYGETGLMAAAGEGQRDVVEWLVRAPGIEIDAQDDDGDTALHLLVMNTRRRHTATSTGFQLNESKVLVVDNCNFVLH